jgi:hypothetical protein
MSSRPMSFVNDNCFVASIWEGKLHIQYFSCRDLSILDSALKQAEFFLVPSLTFEECDTIIKDIFK